MVCPYCTTRNIPGAHVCAHCGAILREIKRARPAPRERTSFGGAALARLGGGKWRSEHGHVQSQIKHALNQVEEKSEHDLKAQGSNARLRLTLGELHLVRDEIERGVQEFQQAQKLGAVGIEFSNNAGVALARRGNLSQAVEMFTRAVAGPDANNGRSLVPQANLSHALFRLAGGADNDAAEQAVRVLQQTIALDGKNPVHYNRLGLIFCGQARCAEALTQFGEALRLSDNDTAQADAHNNLGLAHALSGDLSAAADEFASAIKLDPGHGRALCNQALVLLQQNDSDAATQKLLRAARIDPHSALIRNGLGFAYSQALAINEGIREFKEALGLDALAFEPYYNQGKSYADERLPDIAERYLTRALQITPNSWQALTTMGVIRMGQGQLPQAQQFFKSASALSPRDTRILADLGLCQALSDQVTEAERTFRLASAVAPDDPEMNLNLGWLYLRKNNISQSVAELQIALDRNEKLAVAHNNYGLCEIEMGSYEQAISRFRRAQQLDPEMVQVHYHLGGAYALLNLMDQAVKEWELAVKSEPTFADAVSNLGVAYYRKGQLDQAVTEFRRVITLRKTRMEDFSNLALAYAKQGAILRQQSRKPDDPKAKEAQDKQKIAIEMFDRALALQPLNVMLHSNRGLACFFANRPEDAMQEWTTVTRIDPAYARRRGKAQQSEFDDSIVTVVPVDSAARAIPLPFKTAEYLYRFAPSYDVEEWELILGDSGLENVPELLRQNRRLERLLNSL